MSAALTTTPPLKALFSCPLSTMTAKVINFPSVSGLGLALDSLQMPERLSSALDADAVTIPAAVQRTRAWGRISLLRFLDSDENTFIKSFSNPKIEFDEICTLEDECRLMEEWETDTIKSTWAANIAIPTMATLWQDTYRFLDCSPFHILNSDFHLGFQIDDHAVMAEFLQALNKIALHPFFKGSKELMTAAIQYASICRFNDTRRWDLGKLSLPMDHRAFANLFCQAMSLPLNKGVPLPRVHRDIRLNMLLPEDGEPALSSLFISIETVAWNKHKTALKGEYGDFSYTVAPQDLHNVLAALDGLSNFGVPVYRSAHVLAAWASINHPQIGHPRGEDLREHVETQGKGQTRKAAKAAKTDQAEKARLLPDGAGQQPQQPQQTSDHHTSPMKQFTTPEPSSATSVTTTLHTAAAINNTLAQMLAERHPVLGFGRAQTFRRAMIPMWGHARCLRASRYQGQRQSYRSQGC
ncbi:hypothetical protein B0H66DRAFT_257116 [Apodospora peruviana]|uniref:Uncharacterized protein n=1 Tax=Apodospora peruviana TaxID=516989 RepID=A0AAE0I605_9PEZI|nr:hypothetical protein B0H66DRAFT_257116 [Apodospora peruviana]